MALTGDPELVDFDAAAVLQRVQQTAGDGVQSVMEFSHESYNVLYVSDEVVEMYRDEDHLRDHYGRVLAHLHMDFMERDTYENTLLPNAGRVSSLVTHMDELTLLRIFGEGGGIYVALDPACSTDAVIAAVEPVV